MYKLLFFIFVSLIPSITYSQDHPNLITKLVKKYLSPEKDSLRSNSFMALPVLGYAPETGGEFGLASIYNFYIDKSNPLSRTSNATFMATMTSKNQKNIKLQTDIWTKDNNYHIISEFRYRDWPINFYGIGNRTLYIDETYIDQKLIRIKLDVEKKIDTKTYVGLNLQYENHKIHNLENGGIIESEEILGKQGGQFIALGSSLLIDNRDFTTYTTKGHYLRYRIAYAPNLWTPEDFSGTLLEVDNRLFHTFGQKFTVATQAIYRGSLGKKIPFYTNRDFGGDNIMRGYYLGRYRDKNYLAAQSEIRYRITPRFATVGFAGIGSTFSKSYSFRAAPSYGAGIRYFFSLEHNSSVRFDYAYGEKRPGEKQQKGFYLSLSEAF